VTDEERRAQLIGHALGAYDRGLVSGPGGNLSARLTTLGASPVLRSNLARSAGRLVVQVVIVVMPSEATRSIDYFNDFSP
jgi:ribulose-5-phosphate 4-epimerase/fuculose-1-phosphate aldolase